jgi:uncharacterized RDD family membrane protein YckC
MARRKKAEEAELPLFADLPLRPVEDRSTEPSGSGGGVRGEAPSEEPRSEEAEVPVARTATQAELFAAAGPPPARSRSESLPETTAAPLAERLRGGLADLAVQLLMLAVAVTAAYRLGVAVTVEYWPPFAVLALVFSFLYWVVPLAFWGQTPGMAWVGHLARGPDDGPLTFGQTLRRWLGALLTLSLAGLPLLLALGGRSLSDRLSGSRSVKLEP